MRPLLEGIQFKSISSANKYALEIQFSNEEIKGVVWCCDRNRIPGPNGYNLLFIRKC